MISEIPIGEPPAPEVNESTPEVSDAPKARTADTPEVAAAPAEQSPLPMTRTAEPECPPPPEIPKRKPGRPRKEVEPKAQPKPKAQASRVPQVDRVHAPKAQAQPKAQAPSPEFSIGDLTSAELVAELVNRRRANERTMRQELYRSWVM